jgi:hypothetical protein
LARVDDKAVNRQCGVPHRGDPVQPCATRVFPGPRGRIRDTDNAIAWRTREWSLVRARTIPIPYFDGKIKLSSPGFRGDRFSWFRCRQDRVGLGG